MHHSYSEATLEQFQQIIRGQALAMREAVIKGCRFDTDHLLRITKLELLHGRQE
ncbi:hypothetical protein [Arachnia propionica]|uniref:hypothetical protein n=1 Tax=Arachnia propionica TaxID=1750 RepID=UPI00163B5793|nr:hypothetical protein [Arachnia propionica]